MTISYQANDTVTAVTKNRTVTLGKDVLLEKYVVPGAGEYDVAGIQCEAVQLPTATVYFIRAEDLKLTFMSHVDSEVIKLDDASATNILAVEVRSDDKPSDLKPILKALEPSYVFLIGAGATPEFNAELGLTAYESSTLKATHAGLPLEGTFLVPTA